MQSLNCVPLQIIKHPLIHQAFEDFHDTAIRLANSQTILNPTTFIEDFADNFFLRHEVLNAPDDLKERLPVYLLSLFAWSVQKVVFNFHEALYEEFSHKPAKIDFLPPQDILDRTPFYQPYYKFRNELFDGFTVTINPGILTINLLGIFDGQHLTHQISLDVSNQANSIDNQINTFHVKQNQQVSVSDLKRLIGLALQMILYTCSAEPDIEERLLHKPLIAKNSSYKPRFVRQLEVGARIGSKLSMLYSGYRQADQWALQHSAVRPHLRRAHWHLVWVGSVKQGRGPGYQTPELRWFPPTLVKIPDDEVAEKTVH